MDRNLSKYYQLFSPVGHFTMPGARWVFIETTGKKILSIISQESNECVAAMKWDIQEKEGVATLDLGGQMAIIHGYDPDSMLLHLKDESGNLLSLSRIHHGSSIFE